MAISMDQIQLMMANMQKSSASMMKSMAQLHARNSEKYLKQAQYLQTVVGMYNSMAQWEDLMNKFYSGQTQVAGQTATRK
jgi:hypothetical protein